MDPPVDFDLLHSKVVSALENPAIAEPNKYACREGFWVPLEKGAHTDQFLTTVTNDNYNSCLHSVVENQARNGQAQTLNVTFLLTQKADPLRGLLVEVKHCVDCHVWGPTEHAHAGAIPDLLAISSGHKEPEFVVKRARESDSVNLGFVDLAVDPDRAPYMLKQLQKTSNGDLMGTVAHHENKPWIDMCDLKLVFPKGSVTQSKTHLHFDDMSFKVA